MPYTCETWSVAYVAEFYLRVRKKGRIRRLKGKRTRKTPMRSILIAARAVKSCQYNMTIAEEMYRIMTERCPVLQPLQEWVCD